MNLLEIAISDLLDIRFAIYDNIVHIKKAIAWLKKAQVSTGTAGVSAWYRFDKGWGEPFIETTGYIITTMLESGAFLRNAKYTKAAKSMSDFILETQLEDGGFKTYISSDYPTIFNTAQDLSGLCDIFSATKDSRYYKSAKMAADFLVKNQNKDGSWLKYSYDGKAHSYDSKVSHALLKYYALSGKKIYKFSAVKGLNKVLKFQNKNGWFRNAELPNFKFPPTHTIAYVIEGLLDSGLMLNNVRYIKSAEKAAKMLMDYFQQNNFLPGTFDERWLSKDKYSCLTGDAQISAVWLKLYEYTGIKRYLVNAKVMNIYLKSLQNCETDNKNILGGIKGSHPIYGDLIKNQGYCRLSYVNWAAKYFIDALILENLAESGKKQKYV